MVINNWLIPTVSLSFPSGAAYPSYAAKSYAGATPYYGSYGYDDGQYYPGKYPGTGYSGYKAGYAGYPTHHY